MPDFAALNNATFIDENSRRCRSCRQERREHIDDKCLFEASSFEETSLSDEIAELAREYVKSSPTRREFILKQMSLRSEILNAQADKLK